MITQEELEELANDICDKQLQITRECESSGSNKRYCPEDKTRL